MVASEQATIPAAWGLGWPLTGMGRASPVGPQS